MAINLEKLRSVGDDALANEFDINWPSGIPGFGFLDALSIRTQTVNIPNQTVGTYEVWYKSRKLEKRSNQNQTPTEFTFTLRIDKNYLMYAGLSAYMNTYNNQIADTTLPDILVGGFDIARFPMIVQNIDVNGFPTATGFTFLGCFIKDIGTIAYDQTSGEPLTVDITVSYYRMIPTA